MMRVESETTITLTTLDDETAALVSLAAVLTGGDEPAVRHSLIEAVNTIRPDWVEELLLQTWLFAGFPRALNATREWRRVSGLEAPLADPHAIDGDAERITQGEKTCAVVYGRFYERLRLNIRALHPTLDNWMISEGYGTVLSRAPLDLARRELCIIAACAVARQDRQLHSHLHGAVHAGASPEAVQQALDTLAPLLSTDDSTRYQALWERVKGK